MVVPRSGGFRDGSNLAGIPLVVGIVDGLDVVAIENADTGARVSKSIDDIVSIST
jgi:hypothetical protein